MSLETRHLQIMKVSEILLIKPDECVCARVSVCLRTEKSLCVCVCVLLLWINMSLRKPDNLKTLQCVCACVPSRQVTLVISLTTPPFQMSSIHLWGGSASIVSRLKHLVLRILMNLRLSDLPYFHTLPLVPGRTASSENKITFLYC